MCGVEQRFAQLRSRFASNWFASETVAVTAISISLAEHQLHDQQHQLGKRLALECVSRRVAQSGQMQSHSWKSMGWSPAALWLMEVEL